MSVSASQFERLTAASKALENQYVDDGADWAASEFGWVRVLPSRTKGAIGERLVERWCIENEIPVSRSRNSDADRVIAGHPVEIKFSLWWRAQGFTFQQIRDQDYEYLLCLGLKPDAAYAWFIPKSVVLHALAEGLPGIAPQHGGGSGKDTAWIQGVNPASPPAWMDPYGPSLEHVMSLMRGLDRV